MRFLDTLFNRSINTTRRTLNKRALNKRSKTLALETLEQRIALDASGIRSQLEAVREVYIDDSLVGPTPIVFGKSELIGQDTKSFVITSVAAGSTVEKWDAAANQWRDVSTPPTSSNPRHLLQLLQNRMIQKDDQIRWVPRSTDGVTQKAFEIIGWDDGSETTEPEGVNVPGTVENLEIDIVGDEVRVTWDAPAGGAAVTNYALDQQLDLVTVVPSTQTSHTFAKAASPASYSVTVHANSSEGTGEATTVTVSTGSYVWVDGIVIDPIRDTSGNVLNYDGPNLKPGNEFGNMTNLKNVVLRNADLTNADLINADLTGADLTGANMTAAILNGAVLTDAILTGVNLDVAAFGVPVILSGVRSGGITGQVDQLPPRWRLTGGYLIGPGANLTGADLSYVDLSDTFLNGANLTNVNLSYATLTGSGADLTGTTLTGVQSGSINSSQLILPPGWQLVVGYIIGPGANLTGANLMDVDLTNADLYNADLTGADLTGANLTDANLTGATLTGTDLEGATLNTNAFNMWGLISGGITGPPASLPTDWRFVDGYLIGPYADLTGATLTGADLSGVNLSGANLTGATLTGADLTGAALTDATLTGATLTGATLTDVQSGGITGPPASLPTDYQFINGFLIGPSVQLSGEDLAGLDLADMDLTGAILTYANLDQATLTATNLSGANLTGATLTGADLTGANLTGADLSGANLAGVSGAAKYNSATILPAGFDPVAAGWTLVS